MRLKLLLSLALVSCLSCGRLRRRCRQGHLCEPLSAGAEAQVESRDVDSAAFKKAFSKFTVEIKLADSKAATKEKDKAMVCSLRCS